MRNALLLSGKPTAFLECYPSIYRNIIRPNNCDVFLQYWWDDNWVNKRSRSDRNAYKVEILENTHELIRQLYQPIRSLKESPREYPKYHSSIQNDPNFVQSVQSMMYSWLHVWEQLDEFEHDGKFEYDGICRMRYDLYLDKEIRFEDFDLTKLNIYNDCKHESDCINDHLVITNSNNISIYSRTALYIKDLYDKGTPFCAEILLGRWIKENMIEINHIETRHLMWRQIENAIHQKLPELKMF